MKFLVKVHKARVVKGVKENEVDLVLLDGEVDCEPIEKSRGNELPLKRADEVAEYARYANQCQMDNTKFRKIALHGAKLGDVVSVQIKYLVE